MTENWDCPRCGKRDYQEFYGPCVDCRVEMRTVKPPKPTDMAHAKEQQVAMAARLKRLGTRP